MIIGWWCCPMRIAFHQGFHCRSRLWRHSACMEFIRVWFVLVQASSFSSITDSTMSLNIITVTLNMGKCSSHTAQQVLSNVSHLLFFVGDAKPSLTDLLVVVLWKWDWSLLETVAKLYLFENQKFLFFSKIYGGIKCDFIVFDDSLLSNPSLLQSNLACYTALTYTKWFVHGYMM